MGQGKWFEVVLVVFDVIYVVGGPGLWRLVVIILCIEKKT
jgi:hypothetical protein